MLVYYFVPFVVSNRYLLFWVSNTHNSVTVQNRTHVYMNFFDHKDLWNHLLQLCPKVVKHPVYLQTAGRSDFNRFFRRHAVDQEKWFVFICHISVSRIQPVGAVDKYSVWRSDSPEQVLEFDQRTYTIRLLQRFTFASDSLCPVGSGDRIPVEAGYFAPVQTDPEAYPASSTRSTGSLFRG